MAEGNAPSHDDLVARLAPLPGERWLDVGTGTGAVAIRAARAGADVTGLDLAPALVETAKRLAAEEGLQIRFDVGNAEALPYGDGEFDVVSSAFGVIFAPDQRAATRELARVTRTGGRLGLTTLHPDSTAPLMFRHLWRYAPLPEGAGDPVAWGDETHVRALLGESFDLSFETAEAPPLQETDPEKAWQFMLSSMGPFKTVVESLDDERRAAFREEWFALARERAERKRLYVFVLGTRR